jgi:tRNA(Ile)-lysidine synthase
MAVMSEPVGPDELDRLFAHLFAACTPERFALAVSGGSDSTALMVLLAEWLGRVRRPAQAFTVLTVDHRLRPQSAAEAAAVARQAATLGYAHATLVWEGDKPQTGLQAAARTARYRLMAAYARAHGIGLIFTGHTAEDQAETLLMRLARGSGLDGLSAMAPIADLHEDNPPDGPRLCLARPLLDVPKARLQASLRQRAITWLEDPSNAAPAFERTRLRAARADLDALGLTGSMLGLSARRLQQVRVALERWVADVLDPAAGTVETHACGFFAIDLPRLRALPQEIAARVLARTIAAAGGSAEPVPLAGLEAIALDLLSGPPAGAWTLARAKLTATPGRLLVEREPGREPLPVLSLGAGDRALWDGRFRVAAGVGLEAPVEVRALGVDGLRQVRALAEIARGIPVGSLRALPGFWRGERLLGVPPLAVWTDQAARSELSATFTACGEGAPGP